MKTYRIQVADMLPMYASAPTAGDALRKVERLTGPLNRQGLVVKEVDPDEDLDGEAVL